MVGNATPSADGPAGACRCGDVGEVVCGKRLLFSDPVWPAIIERLERGGKEVVISTLAAPATARERRSVNELCGDERLIEINDVTALPSRAGRPFVTGPFLNVYNEAAAGFLIERGARTICPPVELPLAAVAQIAQAHPAAEFELFAFGRLPLAMSGRCYHARLHGLHKDSCQFTCEKDPDGLAVDTLDGQEFLAINGVQMAGNLGSYCDAVGNARTGDTATFTVIESGSETPRDVEVTFE
jgi:O2-independent ubiquinone biosynthesis protein UbiV